MRSTKHAKPIRPAAVHARKSRITAGAASRHGKPSPSTDEEPAGQTVSVLDAQSDEAEIRRVEEWAQVPCPFCGEELELLVSSDDDGQTKLEDCSVCCRPVSLHVTWEDGELQVDADRA